MEKEGVQFYWGVIIILCILLISGKYYWFNFWIMKKKNKQEKIASSSSSPSIPRGSLGWPLIGETLDFISCGYSTKPVSFMEKRKSLYGDVFKTNILGTPIIVSTDPEVNKVVLQNHGHIFIPAYPKSITELLGEFSILQTNGNIQKRVHALIGKFLKSPQFKARITKDIENSVKHVLASWRGTKTKHIYVQQETKKVTFGILVKMLMSIGPGEDLEFLKGEFAEFIKGLICLPIKFPGTRLYKSLKAKDNLLKMVKKLVEERKLAMEKSSSHKWEINDAADVLLRDGDEMRDYKQSLSLDFISSNIIEMMIPGEETVPMAMTLAVKFLSDSPVALENLREENMELKRQKLDSNEDYNWTDYMSLPFTQNVISETLRMANIINGVWRKALKDVEIKGYLIPKGWCVLASFISIHMDENNYENPFTFDPWRWEKLGMTATGNNFTPFGGGQRLCPGLELSRLEISIFLHHLVTNYRWVAEEDDIVHFPTVKMKRNLPITVTPISS